MAVDPCARAALAESTRWLVGGRITNFRFEESVPQSDDPAIREIHHQFWLLYSDFREHRLVDGDRLSQAQRDMAACCVLFLKSGLPYPWPVLSRAAAALLTAANLLTFGLAGRICSRRLAASGDMAYWPFISQAQYADALQAPVYLSGTGAGDPSGPNPPGSGGGSTTLLRADAVSGGRDPGGPT